MDQPEYATTVEEYKKNKIGFYDKWDRRYRAGDVVEMKEDGYWSHPTKGLPYKQDKFVLICCPNIVIQGLDKPLYRNDEITVDKRRKYSVDVAGLITGTSLTLEQLQTRLTTKTVEIIFG